MIHERMKHCHNIIINMGYQTEDSFMPHAIFTAAPVPGGANFN